MDNSSGQALPGHTHIDERGSESHAQPRRMLSVCETALGGVGRYQDSLRVLERYGYQITVLMPDSDVGIVSFTDRLRTYRRTGRGGAALLRLLRAFRAERHRLRPDVYFFNSTFTLLPLLALRLVGDRTPAIYCAHCWAVSNFDPLSQKGRLVRFVEGRLCGLASLVVNVSRGDLSLARGFGYRGRHVVVENAVPEARLEHNANILPRPDDNTVQILFVGRFDRQKGLGILLAAFAAARRKTPNLWLHLVGGSVRDGAKIALPEGVTHHGWVGPDCIDGYYRAADVLVVPSRWEGLPLVVPEALRNSTPVFVANRSSMADLVIPGETGGVFDLNDGSLERCLAAMNRPDLRSMRAAARASYERRFTVERFADELAGHLDALFSERAR